MSLEFREVPPPKEAPRDEIASAFGLVRGLRYEDTGRMSRCSSCSRMRDGGGAWVPDGLRIGDDAKAVTETCRQNAYNGMSSWWCLECAQQLGKEPTVAATIQRAAGTILDGPDSDLRNGRTATALWRCHDSR